MYLPLKLTLYALIFYSQINFPVDTLSSIGLWNNCEPINNFNVTCQTNKQQTITTNYQQWWANPKSNLIVNSQIIQ